MSTRKACKALWMIPSRLGIFFLFNIETFSGFLIFTLEDKDMKIIVIGATGTAGEP
jgi:hypothetical protein